MAFDLNNFVIDRIVRGVALSQKDDSVLFSINQIQNASLNCASESTDAVDALGTPIATFYRAKSAEFSAENALYDMNLMATQLGTTKKVASATSKLVVPAMETFTVVEGGKYELKHTPKVVPTEIYALNGDSTFGTKYSKATAASATAAMSAILRLGLAGVSRYTATVFSLRAALTASMSAESTNVTSTPYLVIPWERRAYVQP